MALGPQHEEGISLSDLIVPLGLAIVLTTSVSIAKDHPINSMVFGHPQTALVSPITPDHTPQTK